MVDVTARYLSHDPLLRAAQEVPSPGPSRSQRTATSARSSITRSQPSRVDAVEPHPPDGRGGLVAAAATAVDSSRPPLSRSSRRRASAQLLPGQGRRQRSASVPASAKRTRCRIYYHRCRRRPCRPCLGATATLDLGMPAWAVISTPTFAAEWIALGQDGRRWSWHRRRRGRGRANRVTEGAIASSSTTATLVPRPAARRARCRVGRRRPRRGAPCRGRAACRAPGRGPYKGVNLVPVPPDTPAGKVNGASDPLAQCEDAAWIHAGL